MAQSPLQQLENGISYKDGEFPCRVLFDQERGDWFNLEEIIPIITLLETPAGEWTVKGLVSPTILMNANDPIKHLYEVALKDYKKAKGQ